MNHHYFTRQAMTNWLTIEKFGYYSSEDLLNGTFPVNWAVESPEVLAFRAGLESLGWDDLQSLFCERLAFREADRKRRREEIDAGLFFNAPSAFADYGRWARQLTWTVEECIALSLGRRPDVLDYSALLQAGEPATSSELGQEYIARYAIALNWIRAGQLEEEATPGEYLAWLRHVRLGFAPELAEAVEALGHAIGDWRTISEELAAERDELLKQIDEYAVQERQWKRAFHDVQSEAQAKIRSLEHRLAQAELALKLQENQADANATPEPPNEQLDPRERTSLHKIIFAMAQKKYRFDPAEDQWSAVSRIESDIALAGLNLSGKTIRAHLGAAAETVRREAGK